MKWVGMTTTTIIIPIITIITIAILTIKFWYQK